MKYRILVVSDRLKEHNIHPGTIHMAYWDAEKQNHYIKCLDQKTIEKGFKDKVTYIIYLKTGDYKFITNDMLFRGNQVDWKVSRDILNNRIRTKKSFKQLDMKI